MIPLLLILMVVVLLANVGATPFLHVPTIRSRIIQLLSPTITSPTLASPASFHVSTLTFHVTLMPTQYDTLRHANGIDASTSISLTSLLTSSTLVIFFSFHCTFQDLHTR
ncbi:unnamed protein product [Spirodela intermedia]|uniref:Uncharacterized protein n=1 Tax=Spirodela intermedia TaxID=51605 RepID=A0A7I8K3Q9_SPIIN|nr:unnamed protein product [Spirodela intermedia]